MNKKSISIFEMRKILGIGKTDAYWLVNKHLFETVIVCGKMRVMVDSFESWYANQLWYKKVDGSPPGQKLPQTLSIQEAADDLCVLPSTIYDLLKKNPIKTYQYGRIKRIDRESFEQWRRESPRYRKQAEEGDCYGK